MNKRYLTFVIFLFVATPAVGHEDTLLTVQVDGTISEIPASFGRVSFHASGLGTSDPVIEFQARDNKTVLPLCVTRLIQTTNSSGIRLSGSWYHDEKILPPYVSVEFREPKSNPDSRGSHYNFLFNIRNAQVIQVTHFESSGSDGGRYSAVQMDPKCRALMPGLEPPKIGRITQSP